MADLEFTLTKLEADIAAAKVRRQYQKGRLKIIRSYHGDLTKCEAVLEVTKAQIEALKLARKKLIERIYSARRAKK